MLKLDVLIHSIKTDRRYCLYRFMFADIEAAEFHLLLNGAVIIVNKGPVIGLTQVNHLNS